MIALLGMFATGVSFMYGLAIASVLGVLLVLLASLTLLPAMISRFGERVVRPRRARRPRRPRSGRGRLAIRLAHLEPVRPGATRPAGARLAGRDGRGAAPGLRVAPRHERRGQRPLEPQLAARLRPARAGLRSRLQRAAARRRGAAHRPATRPRCRRSRAAVKGTLGHRAREPELGSRRAVDVAVFEAYPGSAPQAPATTTLVNTAAQQRAAAASRRAPDTTVLVGGFTAGSIDFSNVLSAKLPLFIAIVVVLSALLLLVMFRSR